MVRRSSIYSPFQTLGLVSDGASGGCSPVVHRRGLSSFITTPVEGARTLHLYDTKLHLKGISKPIPDSWHEGIEDLRISQLSAYQDFTFAAIEHKIGVYHSLSPVAMWCIHQAPIVAFTIIGNILVSAAEDGQIVAWILPESGKDAPSEKGQILTNFLIPLDFKITCVTHPQKYINKILIGGADGRCMLVNFRTGKVIHIFPGFDSYVTVIQPSPIVDVAAVGTSNGKIYLHNFRVDETIVTFRHESDGMTEEFQGDNEANMSSVAVTAIAFRTDADESMMTADAAGHMYIWDLNEKAIRSEARYVHPGGSALACFLPGEPLLVTSGRTDNSVKVHLFDDANGQARVLRSREGHHLPPTIVRFCGYDGFMMVSAGLDRELRLVSAVQQARNRSFAQKAARKGGAKAKKRRRTEHRLEVGEQRKSLSRRLPRITSFAAGNIRQRDDDYANIVTIHEGFESAYTWRLQDGASHQHVLRPPSGPEKYELAFKRNKTVSTPEKKRMYIDSREDRRSTCVTLSPCGNFAYIGGQDGRIHAYNLQSGCHQGVFEDPSLKEPTGSVMTDVDEKSLGGWGRAHVGNIIGLSVDACGDTLVSAGGGDRQIKFWTMYTRKQSGEHITTAADIGLLSWSTTSDLFAVSCTDFVVYVYDAITRKLARRFAGHTGPIADLCFDINGRRLLSASLDSTLKTWDLPSGRLFDSLECHDAPTSVTVAPSGEYIASTHVNNVGIKLWVDKSKFGPIGKDTAHKKESLKVWGEPRNDDQDTEADSEGNTDSEALDLENNEKRLSEDGDVLPLSEGIITLSSRPASTWTVLSDLHAIKERNKPTEPPKKPQSAPFFIPTVKGIHMQFDLGDADKPLVIPSSLNDSSGGKIRKIEVGLTENEDWTNSELGKLFFKTQFNSATRLLHTLDASGVDMEIRTMDGETTLRNAAAYFTERLGCSESFELTQAHLGVFLRVHGTELLKDEQGPELLRSLLKAQKDAWFELRGLLDSVISLSSYFSGQV